MSAHEGESDRRYCPVCSVAMKLVRKGSLHVDVCDEHGLWVDKGELESLIRRGRLGEATRVHFAEERAKERAKLSDWLLGPRAFLFDQDRQRSTPTAGREIPACGW